MRNNTINFGKAIEGDSLGGRRSWGCINTLSYLDNNHVFKQKFRPKYA